MKRSTKVWKQETDWGEPLSEAGGSSTTRTTRIFLKRSVNVNGSGRYTLDSEKTRKGFFVSDTPFLTDYQCAQQPNTQNQRTPLLQTRNSTTPLILVSCHTTALDDALEAPSSVLPAAVDKLDCLFPVVRFAVVALLVIARRAVRLGPGVDEILSALAAPEAVVVAGFRPGDDWRLAHASSTTGAR